MDSEVFKAILSLDSYNRGYDAGVDLPDTDHQIGSALILDDSLQLLGTSTKTAGFYASSYLWNGEKVISYRGTDNYNPFALDSDLWNGWLAGAGFNQASQAQLAIKYYEQVAGVTSLDQLPAATVTLTGHSLGGGLAGITVTVY